MMNQWHVATAAEAFAAAQFARCGRNVSVQYGANQPEYDLKVAEANGDRMLKVSVKGSQTGRWGLSQSKLKNADYYAAADLWLAQHRTKILFCLVQFKGVPSDALPRMYLATPTEIADRLKAQVKGRGATILYEDYTWAAHAHAATETERIPESWKFTAERLEELAAGLT